MVLHGPSAPPTRVAQACVPCHKTKTRCDGQQPVCSTCSDKGRLCEWPPPRDKEHSKQASLNFSTIPSFPGCVAPPNPTILTEPMTTCYPSTGLHTQLTMPPGSINLGSTFSLISNHLLNETTRSQLQNVYFTKFHPMWPLLHRETFERTPQPRLLVQAVMAVGLWFSPAPESRGLAMDLHDQLLVECGNMTLELLEHARQGLLSPRMDLVTTFQSLLVSMILVPYRADKSLENVMMTHSMLLETFKSSGIYDQARINAASQLGGHHGYPWIFREFCQRYTKSSLAVFQFKLHLILQTVFITIHPTLRISRTAEPAMLRVKVPIPRVMWDSPAAQWHGAFPTDPELLDTADDKVFTISTLCERAILLMDNKPLMPLLSLDRCLGMAIWFWCLRGNESDNEFIENVKPFVLEPLKGMDVVHSFS
ncbi:hypothetical protein CCHL11_02404, partial [Colletotrichum chlorophyti]